MTVIARSKDFLWRSSDESDDSDTDYQSTLAGNEKLHHPTCNGSSVSDNGFWSKQTEGVSYNLLKKFWRDLTPQARQKILKIDKQTFFEHVHKNMHCPRCNGLLNEFFSEIVMYGKSLQQDTTGSNSSGGITDSQNHGNLCMDNWCQDSVLDPFVHPWGGLTTVKGGNITLLDCFLHSKSLKGLQNVFNSARERECERKLLYPDACGGGGRGCISQGGTAGYGKGHGTREICALHTARLSVETLVDFWSALEEDTRQSLLRMKEDDFIGRLMCRFENKRFCRDCRRNVIREFKELKELKRMRKEPRCTAWFCVADTDFQYEVSCDTVQVDWQKTFVDASATYHHFEWAIGTEEGKCDIMEFENVGLSVRVQVSGLDLSGLDACYITLRACKKDGRCNELCVKAHALEGKQCVHCRLVVGGGYLGITIGESVESFFEHAEEIEEEEEDESMENDVNEFDGECTRPQKHAKSPELAREFLLDAAVVIFKEHVEKAFREGNARQNAHIIFVCLALKLLEERVHVAWKETVTSKMQMRLLEEEEKERREEEERKERKRTKEREKKLRRKERLREKEKKEKCCASVIDNPVPDIILKEGPHSAVDNVSNTESPRNSFSETNAALPQNLENHSDRDMDDQVKYSGRKLKYQKDITKWGSSENEVIKQEWRLNDDGLESCRNMDGGFNKQQLRSNGNTRTGTGESYVCSCNNIANEYRSRPERGPRANTKQVWEPLDPQKKSNTRTTDVSTMRSPPKVEPKLSCAANDNNDNDWRDIAKGGDNCSSSYSDSKVESNLGRRENMSTSYQQPQSHQMHNNNNQYPPIFPGSGYYHQGPVSWSAVPTNGLMSFPYSHHYPYANAQFMQYVSPPLLHVPVFPPVIANNSTHEAAAVDARSEKVTDKGNNNGFSLFHFGGPLALSQGFGTKEEIVVGNGNHPIDSVEYNLFAAGNGIKFSIF